jgi:hypothetical protein
MCRIRQDMHDAGKPCNPKNATILRILPLAILLILSLPNFADALNISHVYMGLSAK